MRSVYLLSLTRSETESHSLFSTNGVLLLLLLLLSVSYLTPQAVNVLDTVFARLKNMLLYPMDGLYLLSVVVLTVWYCISHIDKSPTYPLAYPHAAIAI